MTGMTVQDLIEELQGWVTRHPGVATYRVRITGDEGTLVTPLADVQIHWEDGTVLLIPED